MKEKLVNRIATLFTVKSIVTLTLTIVFSYLAVIDNLEQGFMTVYAVIISFYFGTQSNKSDFSSLPGKTIDR